jgi:hypothetical protein
MMILFFQGDKISLIDLPCSQMLLQNYEKDYKRW